MVSIWMLCALRTPGSEQHKTPQACLRPRAPRGPPARPRRRALSAVRPSPAAESAGETELREENPAARRGGQKPSPGQEGCLLGQPRGLPGSAQLNPL